MAVGGPQAPGSSAVYASMPTLMGGGQVNETKKTLIKQKIPVFIERLGSSFILFLVLSLLSCLYCFAQCSSIFREAEMKERLSVQRGKEGRIYPSGLVKVAQGIMYS